MVRPVGYEQNRHPGWELIDMLDTLSSAGLNVFQCNSLVPVRFDYIKLNYVGADLISVLFKTGGALGATVATLTLAYAGGKLDSITKT